MTQDNDAVAERIKAILVAKDKNGEYVYSKQEVRDFIVAAIFEMRLPVTPELQGSVHSFFGDLGLTEEPTPEEMVEIVRGYFREHPLNPTLMAEFTSWGRSVLSSADGGYEETAEKIAAIRTVGGDGKVHPPVAEEKQPEVKLKRGLT